MRVVINAAGISDNFWQRELRHYYSECLTRMIRAESGSIFWVFPSQFFADPEWHGVPREILPIKSGLPFNLSFAPLVNNRLNALIRDKQIESMLSLGWPGNADPSVMHFIWLPEAEILWLRNKNQKLQKLSAKENVCLLTDSNANKNFLSEKFSVKEERILIVPLSPAESTQPMSWTDKEQVRIKYAGGREYFMARSSFPVENMMILLKAFSIFKKKQQTNMKLLIAGSAGEPDHIPHDKLETYKYKDDVHAYTGIAEKDLLKIQGTAYAVIQPAEISSAISILNAMQAEVPVISGRKPDEVSGDTILYSEPFGQESLGEAMIKLFTNEEQKNELIRKGRVWAAQYNIQQSVGFLWEALSSAKAHIRH
jgi:glycosyltransferase involved in cell wall biosynthesis